MKNIKRIFCLALCVLLVLACTPALAAGKVKIGVLVSDATSSEALAFRAYYTESIAKAYDVEFIYSDELTDAAGEKSAIDTFIVNNCKAVISFSSFDRPAQIDQCDAAGIYYAVATGTLTDEQYEEYKDYEYYVGAIGPSMDIEFQTGYDMAAYYIDQGMTKFGMFGGGVPYYVDMHIYRAAGMLTAMVEKGADNKFAIIGQIYQDGGIDTAKIGNLELAAYVGGYDFNDAWFGKLAQMVGTEGIQVILTVGSGVDVLGGFVAGSGVKLATVDSFTPAMGEAMSAGILDYMAGKFAASVGPIFVATYNAVNGKPIRDNDGNALALGQSFWVATDSEQFSEFSTVDSSNTDPAYAKEIMDKFAGEGVSYNDFDAFVAQYSFDEIVALKK
ncbi:MAG: sugar ABC transporter substrate-binding protein [Clostridiales bacterium]|nr:sugar ABC transporter substrate-binding protein [Clostridiales bacterium]